MCPMGLERKSVSPTLLSHMDFDAGGFLGWSYFKPEWGREIYMHTI